MASRNGGGFRLNVLNPGGRDPEQHFDRGASLQLAGSRDASCKLALRKKTDPALHAPVNYHAYAACTGGSFLRETKRAVERKNPVLLLLRQDFRQGEEALAALQKAGIPVAVSLKETGLFQIAEQLEDATRLGRFLRIVAQANMFLVSTSEAADFYRAVCGKEARVAFIPTPYPLHDPAWDFSTPINERRGIFIGTREWHVASRNHLAALLAARRISDATGEPVTVYNFDAWTGKRLLANLGFRADQLRIVKRGGSYSDYLRVVAGHKIIFQLDCSLVPGQVAGDALICRMPCVGGNGAIDRVAFPELCGQGRSIFELAEIARKLVQDPTLYRDALAAAQKRANEELSFAKVARQLEDFFQGERIASK